MPISNVNGHEPAAGVFPAPDEQSPAETVERVPGTALGVVRENGVTMLVLTFPRPEEAGPVIVKIGLDEKGAIELASLLLVNASMKD